ncbi:50S ribosomal protein L15 [Aminithiophilus ramosus]|uniref:Large ribosomal subunit protein uL15 n=2 Tax=Synergistales TaxID=649776 RepID=A0A9Q7EUT3_9BACT|nr:50S ribosomal protein L15 [Aminithiophilus ramosus]QTX31509.1 50S ribosomal protein L15 [Aminithiophilus ramosus]QVL35317.1 50S ribosomal protein L15 [Synergistota bacterium]
MRIHDLRPAAGSRKPKKRLGQGIGSGLGKTGGKGTKGQQARAGGGVRPGFEGGQMPLYRRTPKRGFSNFRFAKNYQIVNVSDLDARFEAGMEITVNELYRSGLVKKLTDPVKVLGDGEMTKNFHVKADAFSGQAIEKIEASGGKAEVV